MRFMPHAKRKPNQRWFQPKEVQRPSQTSWLRHDLARKSPGGLPNWRQRAPARNAKMTVDPDRSDKERLVPSFLDNSQRLRINHPKANKMIEWGDKPIGYVRAKMSSRGLKDWTKNSSVAARAGWTIAKAGYKSYESSCRKGAQETLGKGTWVSSQHAGDIALSTTRVLETSMNPTDLNSDDEPSGGDFADNWELDNRRWGQDSMDESDCEVPTG